MTVCAHCNRAALDPLTSPVPIGGAYRSLCKPIFGLDCYSLVLVVKHPTPCDDCRAIRDEQDSLRRLGRFGEPV